MKKVLIVFLLSFAAINGSEVEITPAEEKHETLFQHENFFYHDDVTRSLFGKEPNSEEQEEEKHETLFYNDGEIKPLSGQLPDSEEQHVITSEDPRPMT